MIFPIDLPIVGQTSLLLVAGTVIMAMATTLLIISYVALLNNCVRTGFIDRNADSLIVLSTILVVVGFMMIIIGVHV